PTAPPLFSSVQPKRSSRGSLEMRIGGSWLQNIGVIAVVLGVIFFLKYAYDSQWIGKGEILWAFIAIGAGILVVGERLRPRFRPYAFGLTGLGIAILYTCCYAAHGVLDVWSSQTAFVGMALVTATASLLSARYDAMPIALLGLIGGFLTP